MPFFILIDASGNPAGGTEALSADVLFPAPAGAAWHEIENSIATHTLAMVDGALTEVPIVPRLEVAQWTAWERATTYRDDFIANRLTVGTTLTSGLAAVWDYDAVGRQNIKDAIDAAGKLGSQAPATTAWRMHDNAMLDVTLADLVAADLAGIMAKQACYQASWAIEARQQAATTADAVAAVDITAGYPASS